MKVWTESELEKISKSLEGKDPKEAIKWALDNFQPDVSLACSFGAEDVALVDMLVKVNPKARIFYLDTGLLFKETYELIDRVAEKYGIKPEKYSSAISVKDMEREYGPKLWEANPDRCCGIRKVVPLEDALKGLKAWITGIRRDQAPTRANAPVVGWDAKFNLVKINPLVTWTWEDVWGYIRKNGVPYNVLHDKDYPSIGCEPCTKAVKPGEDPRAGRWAGKGKTECGLHK
ncbi:MAG: phosphoadenylyl-sulfate reductase [Deltaproteobacteria bacterium]|nr:phosphoadenylyl-sulfate reductase [Deltaproteobacteria bacterium]